MASTEAPPYSGGEDSELPTPVPPGELVLNCFKRAQDPLSEASVIFGRCHLKSDKSKLETNVINVNLPKQVKGLLDWVSQVR